jgi:hypothetical protein
MAQTPLVRKVLEMLVHTQLLSASSRKLEVRFSSLPSGGFIKKGDTFSLMAAIPFMPMLCAPDGINFRTFQEAEAKKLCEAIGLPVPNIELTDSSVKEREQEQRARDSTVRVWVAQPPCVGKDKVLDAWPAVSADDWWRDQLLSVELQMVGLVSDKTLRGHYFDNNLLEDLKRDPAWFQAATAPLTLPSDYEKRDMKQVQAGTRAFFRPEKPDEGT